MLNYQAYNSCIAKIKVAQKMQEKSQNIELLPHDQFQQLIDELNVLNAKFQNLSETTKQKFTITIRQQPVMPFNAFTSSIRIPGLHWKMEDDRLLKSIHNFLTERQIIQQKSEDYSTLFFPHFPENTFELPKIKCGKFTRHVLWIFFILQEMRHKITGNALCAVLPKHFEGKKRELTYDSIKEEVKKIRKAYDQKKFPDFVSDFLLLFPSKSLPESLLK
jgi:hypothetical protein